MSTGVNQADKSAATTKRLLVVDDEPAVRDALERVLRMEGYDVVSAGSCREALECYYERPIDLVLLDINIASENGWDLCGRLRGANPRLPVIVITARPDQTASAVAAGVVALMEKPLDLPRLLKSVSEVFSPAMSEASAIHSESSGTPRESAEVNIQPRLFQGGHSVCFSEVSRPENQGLRQDAQKGQAANEHQPQLH